MRTPGTARIFVGGVVELGDLKPSWGRYVALGVHAAMGQSIVDVVRGVPVTAVARRHSLGPEARLGMAYGEDGKWPDFSAHVAFAPVWVGTEERAAVLAGVLAEGKNAFGVRSAIGIAWPVLAKNAVDLRGPCEAGACGLGIIGVLFPTVAELTYEGVWGSRTSDHRVGFGIGWGF